MRQWMEQRDPRLIQTVTFAEVWSFVFSSVVFIQRHLVFWKWKHIQFLYGIPKHAERMWTFTPHGIHVSIAYLQWRLPLCFRPESCSGMTPRIQKFVQCLNCTKYSLSASIHYISIPNEENTMKEEQFTMLSPWWPSSCVFVLCKQGQSLSAYEVALMYNYCNIKKHETIAFKTTATTTAQSSGDRRTDKKMFMQFSSP